MMQRKVKPPSGVGPGRSAELRVFRGPSSTAHESRLPGAPLRRQRSLTNLSVLTDAEKKLRLCGPDWCDDLSTITPPRNHAASPASPAMSRALSRSEHSLLQPRTPSRIPRGPYAEVKPLSKTSDTSSGGPAAEESTSDPSDDKKTFLKVDPELVVTVLGDLEQLLFSQMLDPETQRKRTVQNVLDLRQNLEDTMSSLRGSQVTHSSLDMTCYDSDDANPRSISSLSNRSSPVSWRYGQASPRLQAGEAPSLGGCRSEHGGGGWQFSHTMPLRAGSRICSITQRLELLESGSQELKSGYGSDSDCKLAKEVTHEDDDIITSWDESSSISSGLSDASGNLSSEECNVSSSLTSLPSTPTASRRSSTIALRTDSEKRSLVESGLSWHSESEERGPRRMEYDSGSLKSEHGSSRWRRDKNDDTPKSDVKKPVSLGQPLRKGKNPPVGVTSPITQTGQTVSKGAKPEQKATDKCKLTIKTAGLQRSSSDAGRDPRSPDAKKPPSGIARPGSTFGYKKPIAPSSPLTGNSATLGKTPKSSGIPVKPSSGSVSGNRKTSLDVSGGPEPGFLSPSARTNIQYRSLPRPAKSSSISVTGGRSASRPLSSSVDASLVPVQGKHLGTPSSRLKEPSKVGGGRLGVNQTDREKEKAKAKAVAQDTECRTNTKNEVEVNVKEAASTTPQRAITKPFMKTPTLSNLDKVNSNSLDFTPSVPELPNKQLDFPTSVACLTPSPAPILNINSASFSQGLSNLRMYTKLSGLHRSMESLPLTISVPPAQYAGDGNDQTPDTGWNDGNLKSPAPESAVQDRNTLPKKGLRYQSHSQDEPKERRHSHTIGGIQDNDDLSPLPPPLPLTNVGKPPLACLVSPSSAPRIARSSSIPAQDSSFELFSSSNLGSSLSLADRPKGTMTRSGSFRDPTDDVHGSVLSLASSASSTYSSQIRKLRRELESSQEKVAVLTTQLSANANLVAAFEQSLVNMTSRLRNLADTAHEKDSELSELRETIDLLKSKNSEAQAVIQGALNPHDPAPRELRIRRQNSSDSISSLNSISSHCSAGSLKDSDSKKKKKKSWLRSSFNKAFSMKKGPKSANSYSDIEEMATPDSSAPTSPKQHHGPPGPESPSLHSSPSSSAIFEAQEGEETEKKEVSELRSELWEKEMKLTDIRLEALNSAHQLEQLRETMHNMQLEVDLLKAENDRLKVVPLSVHPSSSPRRSLALTLTQSLGISASSDTDISPMDGINGSLQREVSLRTVVRVPPQHIIKGDLKQQEFFLGHVKISNKADWKSLDDAVCQIFQDYVNQVDPGATLGLGRDSVSGYNLGHVKRDLDTQAPDPLPSRNLRNTANIILHLKGLKERCVDLLVFESLIPKPMLQHYVSLLLKHRRLLLSGPSGTGKSFLAHRLAEYLVERSGRGVTEGIVTAYNMHQQSCKDLQLYLSNLANQIDRETGPCDVPLVILLDDVTEGGAISELVNGALTCKYHKCPYIIGTTNQPVKMSPNHGLHISFRMLTFSNNVEPANGFLGRYLRRKLLESEGGIGTGHGELLKILDWVPRLWYHLHTFLEKHSTSDFLIGPCFFLSCPIGIDDFRVWFIDLWNNSIIPYLSEGAKDGLKVHGHKAVWEDPVEWVRDSLPWPLAQQDQSKLLHLPPPSMGTSLSVSPPREHLVKESPPSSLETDPLMAMLLKLQEAANYIESPDRETMCDSDLSSTI
ncbi:neuron navigator 1 isoform X2 [Ranitomeya variabilis]|uniref:neuron navigator 1 isoform X2 n=1 Tax=Ranitomeya variabilis TaxID=490064 RepID=UPI004055B8F5